VNVPVGRFFLTEAPLLEGLVLGALVVAGVGVLDDIRGVGAKYKLLAQIAAATVAFAFGMRIHAIELPWIGVLHLGWLALPATVAWFVGIVNAVNLIDGLDGLAAGVVFFACLTNFVIASLVGNFVIMFITASLGGAVIGFLFYNFNPARIFMGDTGSMFLGFVLASASLLDAGTQKTPTLVAIIVPILALGLPITDMLLSIVRRFLAHRSIFLADREHIHHRLLDLGLTHRRAVVTLYLLSVAFTVMALIVHLARSWQVGIALFVLVALLVGVVRFMGHFTSSFVAVGRAAAQERTEPLRRSVPRILGRLAEVRPSDVPDVLAEFGREAGLLGIGVGNAKSDALHGWRWESPESSSVGRKHRACAEFSIFDGKDPLELRFFLEAPTGVIGPQTRILLQLVADAAEVRLAAADMGSSREIIASGASPIARSGVAQGTT
jgi:UDP-GlcNAc:undecaprenyl-phosphate GlcNAc-1-phosphate transferase